MMENSFFIVPPGTFYIIVLGKNRNKAEAPGQRTSTLAFDNFCWVVISGVVFNAVICATLASSMDRFQARVVWLIPLVVWAMYRFHVLNIKTLDNIQAVDFKKLKPCINVKAN